MPDSRVRTIRGAAVWEVISVKEVTFSGGAPTSFDVVADPGDLIIVVTASRNYGVNFTNMTMRHLDSTGGEQRSCYAKLADGMDTITASHGTQTDSLTALALVFRNRRGAVMDLPGVAWTNSICDDATPFMVMADTFALLVSCGFSGSYPAAEWGGPLERIARAGGDDGRLTVYWLAPRVDTWVEPKKLAGSSSTQAYLSTLRVFQLGWAE